MNTQQIILNLLREKLYEHDYIVLPGFGGFLLKVRPASTSAAGHTLHPPSKTISFNAQMRQDDGILVNAICATLNCSHTAAMSHLHDFAAYCSSVLSARRRLNLQGLGFFFTDFENNISFEPENDANFLTSSFGLSPVNLRPLHAEPKEPVHRAAATSVRRAEPASGKKLRPAIPAVLGAMILVIILAVLTPGVRSGKLMSSVFGTAAMPAYQRLEYPHIKTAGKPAPLSAYVANAAGHAALQLPGGKTLIVRVNGSTGTADAHAVSPFEVIAGCFTVMHNATKLRDKLVKEGHAAYISPRLQKGMHAVCLAGSYDRAAALKILESIHTAYPGAWIRSNGN